MPRDHPDYIHRVDAAKFLGCHPRTIDNYKKTGKLQGYTFAGEKAMHYKLIQVQELLKPQEAK